MQVFHHRFSFFQDAFNARFPPPNHVENSIWKGLFLTAVGLGALATMAAAR